MTKIKPSWIILGSLVTFASLAGKAQAQYIDVNSYAIEYDLCHKHSEMRNHPRCKKFFPNANPSRSTYGSQSALQLLQTGVEYYKKGDYTNSDRFLSAAIEKSPNFAEAYGIRGVSRVQLGKKQDGLADLQKAKYLLEQQQKTNTDLYQQLEKIIELARSSNVKTLLGKSEKNLVKNQTSKYYIAENSSAINLKAGIEALSRQDYNTATTNFDAVLERSPNTQYAAYAYFGKGTILFQTKKYDSAISTITQGMQIVPDYPQAYYIRGLSYLFNGDKRNAIIDCQKAAQLYQRKGDEKQYQEVSELLQKLNR